VVIHSFIYSVKKQLTERNCTIKLIWCIRL